MSSDISSFHSIEAHKQDGLYHCTVRASNSTVCKVCGYHSIHLVPQILKTKWFVPQMDLAGKPWFHRLVEAKSREGQKLRRRWLNGDSNFVWFHFGRAAMQHGICVWKKHMINCDCRTSYDNFNVIRVGILFGKKGIACHLHQLACILFSEETYTIHGIPIWQCGEKCKWQHPEIMIPSSTSCNISRIYMYT